MKIFKQTEKKKDIYIYTYIYVYIYIYIYIFWLRWVFVVARGLSLVAVSRRYSLLWCTCFLCSGFSCCGAQALGAWASVVVPQGLSCSAARGIFPDKGSNLCPLHWQADSQPLRHQGSPKNNFSMNTI